MKPYTYTMPRSFGGFTIPIAIQSCYMRNYCQNKGWEYKLPQTEICIKDCYQVFWEYINSDLDSDLHILICSIFVIDGISQTSKILKNELERTRNIYIYSALENSKMNLMEAIEYIEEAKAIRCLQNISI